MKQILKSAGRSIAVVGVVEVTRRAIERIGPMLKAQAAQLVIVHDHGITTCKKGRVSNAKLSEIGEILSEGGVEAGKIKVAKNGRTSFSGSIPEHLQQSIRNVLHGL